MVRAYSAAKEKGFHYITGCEVSFTEGFSLIFLAKTFLGYKKLCRLLSKGFHGQEKSKIKLNLQDAVAFLNPNETQCLLPPRNYPSSQKDLKQILEAFQPAQLVTRRLQPDADHFMAKQIEKLPKQIKKVWTWDAHFHDASRFELFEVLQAIKKNIPIRKHLGSFNAEAYLKHQNQLKRFQVPKEWIFSGLEIAESCQFSADEIRYRYPQEWLPPGKTAFEFLKELCALGIKKRYPLKIPPKVSQQLHHELCLVKELQYEDYFLTVWDIVSFARSKDILCQGRGSAANSVICYLLEITSIDPVEMNLLFERFISKERNEAPDIDVDFEHERREEVIQYVYQKYGRHRSGMVATLITYRTKSAIRDIGKALEINELEISKLSKMVRWKEKPLEMEASNPQMKRLIKLAKQLKGFPRHLGQHTGGMIICQDRLDEICPIEPARMEERSLVQWDKYDIEKLGLLKIDLLSLGMLTAIKKSFHLLEKHLQRKLELHQIPHNDPKTYQMIQESRTLGVFQIESRAQMSMLPRLKPKNFYDLVVEVAIVRPGPIQGGMVHPYLKRRMGLEKISYAHPKLKPILEKTLGIPIFQEQVMKMAIEVAGYSPGEADALRRAMGAWKKSGNLESFATDICTRLRAQGIDQEFAERICQQILGFGEYGFPESHAASFALLTYASSYLKAHYPAFFLCALLNSQPMGFYSRYVLMNGFKREDVQLLGVSLDRSVWNNQMEELDSGEWAIRLGFRNIKSLNQKNVDSFIQSRNEGDANLMHFDISERSAIALAIDSKDRRYHYWKALDSHQDSLKAIQKERALKLKDLSEMEHLHLDFEMMNTSLRQHPTELIRKSYWNYPVPKEKICLATDLIKHRPKTGVFVFGQIEVIQSPPTAKGVFFITLEDESGFLNLVLKPNIFKKFKEIIKVASYLLVHGELQAVGAHQSILVKQIYSPNQGGLKAFPNFLNLSAKLADAPTSDIIRLQSKT